MKPAFRIFLALLFLQLAACAAVTAKKRQPVVPVSPDARYEQADLAELLLFGDTIAGAASKDRETECQHIQTLLQTKPGLGLSLHLFQLQLLEPKCGDPRQTLAPLQAGKAEFKDARIVQWLNYQEQFLIRLEASVGEKKELERQLQASSLKEKTTHRQMKTRETELKTLQEKLDALKSIEENLDDVQDGNTQ